MDIDGATKIVLWVVPVLFALTGHELAHAWVADLFGDSTARNEGRLSWNPFAHIDFFGTLIVPAFLFWIGGFVFGWAKPVPINELNFSKKRLGMFCVALSGSFANLVMALIWMCLTKLTTVYHDQLPLITFYLAYLAAAGVKTNVVIGLLNLLPIPPLDGSRVITSLISEKISYAMRKWEMIGLLLLVGLIAMGVAQEFLDPIINGILTFLRDLFSVPDLL